MISFYSNPAKSPLFVNPRKSCESISFAALTSTLKDPWFVTKPHESLSIAKRASLVLFIELMYLSCNDVNFGLVSFSPLVYEVYPYEYCHLLCSDSQLGEIIPVVIYIDVPD